MSHAYKIRKFVSNRSKAGTEYMNYSLTVPNDVAEALPDGMKFVLTITDDGLLYIPQAHAAEQMKLPNWARSNNGKAKRQPAITKTESETETQIESEPANAES